MPAADGQQSQPAKRKPAVSITETTGEPAADGLGLPPLPDLASADLPDAMTDINKLLAELEVPAGALAGDAAAQGDGTLDILAGLDQPEMAATGLENDLSGIDGGGLPAPAQKSPQKSRR